MKCADEHCGRKAKDGSKYCSPVCTPKPPPHPVYEEPKKPGRKPASLFHRIDGLEAFEMFGPETPH